MKILMALIFILPICAFSFSNPKLAFTEAKKNNAVIVDVREKSEIAQGMVEGAVWFPLSRFSDKDWEKDFNKVTQKKKIYLYCKSGRRSEKVRQILKQNGVTSFNLGGFEKIKEELSQTLLNQPLQQD